MRRALRVPGLLAPERLVLANLTDHAAHDTREAWPSRDLLAAETGLSHQTIKRAIAKLHQLGYVTRTNTAHAGQVLTVRVNPDKWPVFTRPPARKRAPRANGDHQ